MLEHDFDRKESSIQFVGICMASVVIGLTLGGIIDATVRKVQKDDDIFENRKYGRAFTYFLAQAFFNILVLLLFTKASKNFVPWLQLSVSGALFGVLLFSAQRNLVNNVLRITNF